MSRSRHTEAQIIAALKQVDAGRIADVVVPAEFTAYQIENSRRAVPVAILVASGSGSLHTSLRSRGFLCFAQSSA